MKKGRDSIVTSEVTCVRFSCGVLCAWWSRSPCGPGVGVFGSLWVMCVGLGVSIPNSSLEAI